MNLRIRKTLIMLVVFATALLMGSALLTGNEDTKATQSGTDCQTVQVKACSAESTKSCCEAKKKTECCPAMKDTKACPTESPKMSCPKTKDRETCSTGNTTPSCAAEDDTKVCPIGCEKACCETEQEAKRCTTMKEAKTGTTQCVKSRHRAKQAAKLRNIGDIKQLRSAFNRAKGHPRLILLFSPTCPVCVRGARWVQKEILAKHPDPQLKVYAIWFSMYPGDARSKWKVDLLSDCRVTHFWDEERVVGRFFATHRDPPPARGVEWDAFFVYGPEASWDGSPAPLRSFGRPVRPAHKKLQAALVPLLKGETQ